MPHRAVFFDRDGTINQEVCYLSDPAKVHLIGNAAPAVRSLGEAGFKVVVITNQAGIARGYFSQRTLDEVHAALRQHLQKEGAALDGIYYCPHHPEHGIGPYKVECECRKPKPGMLRQAARELDIDLSRSFVVGDKVLDLEAGRAAGCRGVLVRTGYGLESEQLFQEHSFQPDFVADDAWQAAQWILRQV